MRAVAFMVVLTLLQPASLTPVARSFRSAPHTEGAGTTADHDVLSLFYSTYLGGSGIDEAKAVEVGPDGDIYVAGDTDSHDFLATTGAYRTIQRGMMDVFVARLNPTTKAPVYVTVVGSRDMEAVYDLAVDAEGAAYIVGMTGDSGTFPLTEGVFDRQAAGQQEGFVTKISPDGASLEYSTYLGGQDNDSVRGIALDASGMATVVGYTRSPDLPVTAGAFDTACGSDGTCDAKVAVKAWDSFVARIDADASRLVFGTYLGGRSDDYAYSVSLDESDHAYLTGLTWSYDFPASAGAFDETYAGLGDGYVAVLEPGGGSLSYATFLGGSLTDTPDAIAIDRFGAAFVTGMTQAADFPVTAGAFDTRHSGGWCGLWTSPYECRDAFVAKLAPGGSAIEYATLLGGRLDDYGRGIEIDETGVAYVIGGTGSDDFPSTPGSYDPTFNGDVSAPCRDGRACPDLFVARLSTTGSRLDYATFVGGEGGESGADVARDADGRLYIAGIAGAGLPTTDVAYDATYGGDDDGFGLLFRPVRHTAVYFPLFIRP